jgi:hypothetical protein
MYTHLMAIGLVDGSDQSWMHIERTKERILENVVKKHDRDSVNAFKAAQVLLHGCSVDPYLIFLEVRLFQWLLAGKPSGERALRKSGQNSSGKEK